MEAHDWARLPESFHREIQREHLVLVEREERDVAGETIASSPTTSRLYHPTFPQHWERRPLHSLAEWVNGLAFRKIQFSSTGKPVIKIAEIKGGISGQTNFSNQTFDNSVRIQPGDLLFSWSGQPETSIDAFWWRGPEGWLNQHVFRVTPTNGIDTTFFYYLLRYLNLNFIGIARNKQTTGLGHVIKRDLEHIEVAFPPLLEQHAIAHILGTLDDKIELNRRRNETLEAMARALFKSWFVDFDPVRAKAEGRQPPGMSAEIAELFPDSFEESELGEIPAEWEVRTFGAIAREIRQSLKPSEVAGDTPYIGLQHMPRRNIALSEWGRADEVSSRKLRFHRGQIWFGKLRPYFHKVGIAPLDGVCSTDVVVIEPTSGELSALVLGHISSDDFVAYTDRTSFGTKMPRTKWQDMAKYEVAVPPSSSGLPGRLSAIFEPMTPRIVASIYENKTLAELRDTLLPRLLSGEIRVLEALVEQIA